MALIIRAGAGKGLLPVASGGTERGFSFSERDASGGTAVTLMTYREMQANR